MSTVTLPPIGAKIRVTTTWPGDASLIVEGRVLSHAPSGRYAMVGRGGARTLTAYLTDDEGGTVVVEVLEPPLPTEPPINTVLLGRKPNPAAGPGGGPDEIVTVLWRDDTAASGDEFRWFSSHHGFEQSFRWADVQPEPGETIVRLVPDPAASAPTLPWRVDAVDGVSVLADRHGVSDVWARDGEAYIQFQSPGRSLISRSFTAAEARALAAVLLAAADDQEAGQR